VQRKLNESNYVVRKGKGKSVVIHVDRMQKLPISSLDGESSVTLTDPHTHTSEDNETSVVPSKRCRTQTATDVSTSHAAETVNCSDRGDSISSVDKTADNHSNVFNKAINSAAEAVSGSPDTCQTPELLSQSTGNVCDYACAPTGNASGSLTLCTGQRKRRHCGRPKRFLELIHISSTSSPLIGRSNLVRGYTSHGSCRLASIRAVAIFVPACRLCLHQVIACIMADVRDIESGVASTSVEDADAPAATIEAPSGVTETMVKPVGIPPALPFDWGRGPFARDGDRGIRVTWRALTSVRQGRKPKRPFPPCTCELCREPRAFITRSAYNTHLKRVHDNVAFHSAELDRLVFRNRRPKEQAQPQAG